MEGAATGALAFCGPCGANTGGSSSIVYSRTRWLRSEFTSTSIVRNEKIIAECREAGARIRLIPDGDVAGAISVAWRNSGNDILFGIGGTPEGVIVACALKALGGTIQGKLWPRDDDERKAALDAGYDLDKVLTTDDLVSGEEVFFAATGISSGDLLKGVRYWGDGAATESLVMRSKTGTIRKIQATHRWQKLMRYSAVKFD